MRGPNRLPYSQRQGRLSIYGEAYDADDRDFLIRMHNSLIKAGHKENTSPMYRLRDIIAKTPAKKRSPDGNYKNISDLLMRLGAKHNT